MPLENRNFIHPFHLARLLFSRDLDQDFSARPRLKKALSQIDAAAVTDPEILFLSSEDVALRYEDFDILRRNLSRWASQIKILLYVRDPVSYYRSMIQHHVKSQYFIPSPGTWTHCYLETIKSGQDVFGEDFEVVPLQRSSLHEGSIVNDVVQRCGLPVAINENFDTIHSNSSSAAETSAVLQSFMRQFQPTQKKYGKRNTKLRLFLEKFVQQNNLDGKCQLKESVTQTLLAKSRDALIDLRSNHGLVFDAIDYDTLEHQQVHEEALSYDTIAQLCVLDMSTVASLVETVNTSFVNRYDLPPLEV